MPPITHELMEGCVQVKHLAYIVHTQSVVRPHEDAMTERDKVRLSRLIPDHGKVGARSCALR